MRADRGCVWSNLRRSQNERGIHIDHRVARCLYTLERLSKKKGRVCALPARIRGREEGTDIGRSDGAEQGISQRVQQDVTIRVPAQAFRMRQCHAANLERNAALEFVRVPAVADAGFGFQVPVSSLC